MEDDDYYSVNWNLFRRPQLHLYPLLGVEYLISDRPFDNSREFESNGQAFWLTRFLDHNTGQYSPSAIRYFNTAGEILDTLSDPQYDPKVTAVLHTKDFLKKKVSSANFGHIQYEKNSIHFTGKSKGWAINVLPVLFSNCLQSENGYLLVRSNLILTGIVYQGEISDTIRLQGPPFSNGCIRKDIENIKDFGLLDRYFPYPEEYDHAILNYPWQTSY